MRIEIDAAIELYKQSIRTKLLAEEISLLSTMQVRLDTDAWAEMKNVVSGSEKGLPIDFYLNRYLGINTRERGFGVDRTSILTLLTSLLKNSQTFEQFRSELEVVQANKNQEILEIQNEPLKHKISTFSGEEASVPQYIRALVKLLSMIKVRYLKEYRKPIGKEEAELLISLKLERGGERDLNNIKQTVSGLLGVEIDAFQPNARNRRSEATPELDVDKFVVQANGSGIKEALRLIFDYEFEHPQILLIEEPETHLHPALETNMMRYLKRISDNCQVFLTTHSTNFLDTAEMNNVYLVSKNSSSTRIQQLSIEDAEDQLPKELGLRLSSLFMFDKLVFVEGPSDEAVIREWAAVMGVNLSQPNIGFVHMGGVRNFAHFATDATLSFLTKRQVNMTFLMDRDEKDDPEVAKLQRALQGKADVKVLQKRELENYLISPDAITKFIGWKQSVLEESTKVAPTVEEVKSKISQVADQLKQLTIDKRAAKVLCEPLYPARNKIFRSVSENSIKDNINQELSEMLQALQGVKDKVDEVYKQQSEIVEQSWSSSKLDIVQGDVLLDNLCQLFGVRFKKEHDSARLAKFMQVDDIDLEIKTIIRAMSC